MTGRPCELTSEVQDAVVEALECGVYLESAAALAGISKDTLYRWLKRGARARRRGRVEAGELPFVTFSDAVKKALAETERDLLLKVKAAGDGVWQAAAWMLERRWQGRWGRDRSLIRELIREQKAARGNGSLPADAEAAGRA